MGTDFSELDAQLASLGSVRGDILQIARKLAGDTSTLTNVDQALAALGSGVDASSPRALSAVPAPKAKPAPQLVSAPAATPARAAVPSQRPAAQSSLPASAAGSQTEPPASTPAAPMSERSGPPHSEEIALPDPVQHHDASPRSGELALDGAVPRSGSFALDPTPAEANLDEDTDSDFEAEFAALSGVEMGASAREPSADSARTKSTKPKSLRPGKKAESVRPEPQVSEPVKLVSEDDEETDAVLALFDAADAAPGVEPVALDARPTASTTSVSPIGGLSDELEPSMAPPAMGSRDPDAEFDALFDEASSPSSMPSTPATDGDQDSVDDLLRDLGSPRVPQDLAVRAAQISAPVEDDLDDPTAVFDMSTFDAVTGGQSSKADVPSIDEDFEIEMDLDEVVDDEKPQPKAAKPAVAPPRPPPQPPSVPGGVEKRPSFLGRLFGGPNKDPADNK